MRFPLSLPEVLQTAGGIAASFMLGAEGVQVGTRFLASEECQIHSTYKQLVVDAKDTDNVVTGRTTVTLQKCKNKIR